MGADLGSLLAPGGSNTATATENAGIELSFRLTAVDTPAYAGAPLETEPLTGSPEVATVGETLTQTTPEIEGAINELTQQTGRSLSRLQECIANPGNPDCLKFAGGTLVSLGAAFGGAYNLVHGFQSLNNLAKGSPKGTPTPTASASASSSSNPAEPTDWILNTVPGTSVEAFDKFIKTLPDRGQGQHIVFPGLPDQVYVGLMTRAEAEEVNKNPIVDQLSQDTARDAGQWEDQYANWNEGSVHSKVSPRAPSYSFISEPFTPAHLRLLAYPKNQNWYAQPAAMTAKYIRDSSDGYGTFVYVLDSGCDFSHPVSHS